MRSTAALVRPRVFKKGESVSVEEKHAAFTAFKAAFPLTVPIFAGFWFLSFTYGANMAAEGFAWWYPAIMAMFIFGGSLEFLVVGMLLSTFDPLATLLVSLMVQLRHAFYGLSMLDKFRGTGWKKPFLIFGMCDETFSINCSAQVPEGVDRGWFMLWVTLLNYLYWVSGAAFGGIFGGLLPFDTTGLSFAMTALFVVIFLDQWLRQENHGPAFVGFACAIICLLVFGTDGFMVPALLSISAVLLFLRPDSSKRRKRASEGSAS